MDYTGWVCWCSTQASVFDSPWRSFACGNRELAVEERKRESGVEWKPFAP